MRPHIFNEHENLALCLVCGGAEGTLTTECFGRLLLEEKLDAIYFGGLDFIGGGWHYDLPPWLRAFF
jgi:predicted metal-binding protein